MMMKLHAAINLRDDKKGNGQKRCADRKVKALSQPTNLKEPEALVHDKEGKSHLVGSSESQTVATCFQLGYLKHDQEEKEPLRISC